MTMIPNNDFLIVALDFDSTESTLNFLKKVPEVIFVKVGMELFYSEGPGIFRKIRDINPEIKIFLDLKINDIPKTIEKTVRKLASFNPDYLTLFSGKAGIEAARFGRGSSSMKILNVTVLTSEQTTQEQVISRAIMSYEAGADGIICSGLETAPVRTALKSDDFIIVNPGIRLTQSSDDQVRTVTPRQAFNNGASNIVVGRPVTLALNPSDVVAEILESLN